MQRSQLDRYFERIVQGWQHTHPNGNNVHTQPALQRCAQQHAGQQTCHCDPSRLPCMSQSKRSRGAEDHAQKRGELELELLPNAKLRCCGPALYGVEPNPIWLLMLRAWPDFASQTLCKEVQIMCCKPFQVGFLPASQSASLPKNFKRQSSRCWRASSP